MTLDVPRIASSWAQNTRTHRLLRSSPASYWAYIQGPADFLASIGQIPVPFPLHVRITIRIDQPSIHYLFPTQSFSLLSQIPSSRSAESLHLQLSHKPSLGTLPKGILTKSSLETLLRESQQIFPLAESASISGFIRDRKTLLHGGIPSRVSLSQILTLRSINPHSTEYK